jgi:hypothetical protein
MARRLIQLIFEQQRARDRLPPRTFRVRGNAEGVALNGGDRPEAAKLLNRVERARCYVQAAEYWYATGFSADRP